MISLQSPTTEQSRRSMEILAEAWGLPAENDDAVATA